MNTLLRRKIQLVAGLHVERLVPGVDVPDDAVHSILARAVLVGDDLLALGVGFLVANVLMGVVNYGLDIQEAVHASRFHHQWLPDELLLEDRFSPDTVRLLEAKGHKIKRERFWGDAECIMVDLETGERLGASDGRNNGKAVGF